MRDMFFTRSGGEGVRELFLIDRPVLSLTEYILYHV